jgi:acyl-CoA thioesterase FadM
VTASQPPVSLDVPYRVRFDEAGADGTIQPAVLLAWAQDAAWVHSTALGFGREWYADRGLFWLVRGAELTVIDPPRYGDEVIVRTEIVGFRRVLARRLTTVRTPGGAELARSLTDWALIDSGGRPTRIPDIFVRLADVPTFRPIAVEPADATPVTTVELAVRARDIDPMGHANNAAYIAWADEALWAARLQPPGGTRTYRIVYLRPTPRAAAVAALVRPLGSGGAGIVLEEDGREVARIEVLGAG